MPLKFKILVISLLCLVLCSNITHGQTKRSKIDGFLEPSFYTYAYLYLANRGTTVKMPILNKKFSFIIKQENEFETAILYFGIDSNRTYADILDKRSLGFQESKIIALEDTIVVYVKENVKESLVVGGSHTNALNAMDEANKTGNYKTFFEQYDKSPVSLLLLSALVRVEKRSNYSTFLDYEKIFHSFPEDLQNSKKGLEIKELLKAKN